MSTSTKPYHPDPNHKVKYYSEDYTVESIKDIEVDNINQIDIRVVVNWYKQAEKLIKSYAETFSRGPYPAVNQLRYAGHHLAKYIESQSKSASDLIDAYKHCKRSVYDIIDDTVSVITLYWEERNSLIASDTEKFNTLNEKVTSLLRKFIEARAHFELRIDFYDECYRLFPEIYRLKTEIDKEISASNISKTAQFQKEISEHKNKLSRDTRWANIILFLSASAALLASIEPIVRVVLNYLTIEGIDINIFMKLLERHDS